MKRHVLYRLMLLLVVVVAIWKWIVLVSCIFPSLPGDGIPR